MKINNDIMQLLNNNLDERTSAIKPVEKIRFNVTGEENPTVRENRIMYLIDTLTEGIYNIFKSGNKKDKDSYHSVDVIKDYYAEQIKELNSLLKIDDITIKYNGNIGLFFRNKKIGYLSMGNEKLKENKHAAFVVWSIVGKITCNFKTDVCTLFCYNGCRETKGNLYGKIHNLILSMLDIFEDLMIRVLSAYGQYKNKKLYCRIHEDGDFYNLEYLQKWRRIAEKMTDQNIKFMAYSKELVVLQNYSKISTKNLMFRYSIVDDTKPEYIEYAQKNNIPTYIVLGDKKVVYGKFNPNNVAHVEYMQFKNQIASRKDGCVGSCKHCKKCYNDYVKNIFTVVH